MEKMLLLRGLGTGGRQNELIELAITYHFASVEIDMADLLGRYETLGKGFALQFLTSANTKVGTFKLPIDFGAADEVFAKQVAKTDTIAELAGPLHCKSCYVEIEAGSDSAAFQENFDRQTRRIGDVAKLLEKTGIRIGLKMEPAGSRKARTHKFIETTDQLLTMIRMCGSANVGLCLDTGEWMINGGTNEQIASVKRDKIVEVRFSDAELHAGNKVEHLLPGKLDNSLALGVCKHLQASGYDGPIGITGHASVFNHRDRDAVMRDIAKALNCIKEICEGTCDGFNYAVPVDAVEDDETAADGESAEMTVGDAVVVGTGVAI